MRISRIRLENWRNFRSLSLPIAQRAFIIGPNASGKSNLLDAFRFLKAIADPEGGLQRGSPPEVVYRRCDAYMHVSGQT